MRPIRDLIQRFQELKENAFGKVEEAAKTGNVREVSLYARTADECENALQHLRRLEATAQRLEELLRSPADASTYSRLASINTESSSPRWSRKSIASPDEQADEVMAMGNRGGLHVTYPMAASTSRKGEGIKAREEWVAKAEAKTNIQFRKEGGVTYRIGEKGRVGIAFASELGKLPNRWFLGLPEDDEYGVVVLLCRSLESQIWDFVIPVIALEQDWWRLSRSGGQIKFNVRKDGVEYSLQVPNAGKRSIGIYLGKLDELEKLAKS